MNKFISFVILFIVFSLVSCERGNGSIGSGKFVDDRPELGEKLTFPVVSYTIGWDSVSTKNPSQVILGNYDDPVFGRTNASFVSRILLSKSSPDFGAGTVCDSVKIRIAYSGYYGIEGDNIHLEVSPVSSELIDSISYYSNGSIDHENAIVDTLVTLAPSDTVFNGVDELVGYLTFDEIGRAHV